MTCKERDCNLMNDVYLKAYDAALIDPDALALDIASDLNDVAEKLSCYASVVISNRIKLKVATVIDLMMRMHLMADDLEEKHGKNE